MSSAADRGAAPRLAPIPVRALGVGGRLVATVTARATKSEPPNVFTTLARHRRLFRAWIPFASWLLFRTDLPRTDVELVILRTAWNCRSEYEWVQHVTLASKAGVDRTAIHRVADGPDVDGWTGRQRLLLQATDELHQNGIITDGAWTALALELSDHELLELCFVVGHYEMLAMTLNTVRVPPEPTALARLDRRSADLAGELRRSRSAI